MHMCVYVYVRIYSMFANRIRANLLYIVREYIPCVCVGYARECLEEYVLYSYMYIHADNYNEACQAYIPILTHTYTHVFTRLVTCTRTHAHTRAHTHTHTPSMP
jgi:hypothetical protein